jgi:hypothetical protein
VYIFIGEVKIFGMSWNSVVVMTVGTQVKETVASMIGARTVGVTLIGEILWHLETRQKLDGVL